MKLTAMVTNLESAVGAIDSANFNAAGIHAMAAATEVLKSAQKESGLDADKVADIKDEFSEMMENNHAVNDMLSSEWDTRNAMDEDEANAQLAELMGAGVEETITAAPRLGTVAAAPLAEPTGSIAPLPTVFPMAPTEEPVRRAAQPVAQSMDDELAALEAMT